MTKLGEGEFVYEVADWGELPDGWKMGDVAAIGVDHNDQVYVFHRGEHPMLVFDRNGRFLRAWGEDTFQAPHGIDIGRDGMIYCTDASDHTVRKFTPEGKLLLTLGTPGESSPFMSGRPFNRCTHTALSPRGDIYVSDGYMNARIHKYTPDGKLEKSWGECGSSAGQFYLPHNLCSDEEGWVYVADRENHRIQVFDGDGKYETSYHGMHRPCALCRSAGESPLFYVGELGPNHPFTLSYPNLGPRISILNSEGDVLARLGDNGAGTELHQFIAPHGIATDSHGDIYLGEVSYGAWEMVLPGREKPERVRVLRKLTKV
ncbi:peptidyl-alpha-hydroxyglycine alpha-amidating lyase family protein [Paraburkholderia sp. BCC1884]|uniref:peptidyl-alpha-hydroxyglycine alpha-amidating lyase family protein n=1 Tax=Paraburkholderia sp. BCC1884 TaxID=2562668 RepID=UPI00118444D8|nr:peptidyl-alpha-hydroxyglycine alpha-amidating lyase family protein [Paraburkholderia sp. BCC1884]